MQSKNESLRRAIALTYQTSVWLQQMQSHEYDNIRLLLCDHTISVRRDALGILKYLAKIDQPSAITMALQVNIEDDFILSRRAMRIVR